MRDHQLLSTLPPLALFRWIFEDERLSTIHGKPVERQLRKQRDERQRLVLDVFGYGKTLMSAGYHRQGNMHTEINGLSSRFLQSLLLRCFQLILCSQAIYLLLLVHI